jgi:hypothetical protein
VWTHRRFTWQVQCPDHDMALVWAQQVRPVLQRLMNDTPQFYRDAWMSGMALGLLNFQVTISDRDQWWVARRARFLIDELRKHTDLPLHLLSEDKTKLPAHPNRGRYRLRRQRRENAGG